jgi:nitrite reductase (NADH) small subunit
MTWTTVCALSRLEREEGVAALLPGHEQVAVFRTHDDEIYALGNIDPHSQAAVLSRGIVGDMDGTPVVISPMHKERFDLRTGICLEKPDVAVTVYPVQVASGVIQVQTP